MRDLYHVTLSTGHVQVSPRTDTHTPVVGEWVYWYAPHELSRRVRSGRVVRLIPDHDSVCVDVFAGRQVVVHLSNLISAKTEGATP